MFGITGHCAAVEAVEAEAVVEVIALYIGLLSPNPRWDSIAEHAEKRALLVIALYIGLLSRTSTSSLRRLQLVIALYIGLLSQTEVPEEVTPEEPKTEVPLLPSISGFSHNSVFTVF